MILVFFYWLSAIQLVAAGAVYVAALFGCEVFAALPMTYPILLLVMVIVAAIYYGKKWGDKRNRGGDGWLRNTPRWTKVLTGILLAYAIANFLVVLVLLEGGGPDQLEDGSFALMSHGTLIRQLTEEEYGRYRAYEAMLFAGHWMFFSSFSLMLLAGAKRMKERIEAGELLEQETQTPEEPMAEKPPPKHKALPDQPPTLWGAIASVGTAVLLVWILHARQFRAGALTLPVSMMLGVLYVRRRWGRWKDESQLHETPLGCLAIVPAFILVIVMTWEAQWFTYVAIACGPEQAITEAVIALPADHGPQRLSNGDLVNHRLLTVISLVIWPPGLLLGGPGLIYLADVVGRYIASRPWRRNVTR